MGDKVQGSGLAHGVYRPLIAYERGVVCTCQQKLDTKLKKLGIKIEYLYKIQ